MKKIYSILVTFLLFFISISCNKDKIETKDPNIGNFYAELKNDSKKLSELVRSARSDKNIYLPNQGIDPEIYIANNSTFKTTLINLKNNSYFNSIAENKNGIEQILNQSSERVKYYFNKIKQIIDANDLLYKNPNYTTKTLEETIETISNHFTEEFSSIENEILVDPLLNLTEKENLLTSTTTSIEAIPEIVNLTSDIINSTSNNSDNDSGKRINGIFSKVLKQIINATATIINYTFINAFTGAFLGATAGGPGAIIGGVVGAFYGVAISSNYVLQKRKTKYICVFSIDDKDDPCYN